MITTENEVRSAETWGPGVLNRVRQLRREQQSGIAADRERWIQSHQYYYDRLKHLLQFIVEPGKRVLGLRCQTGHLLESVLPSHGVGVEISEGMVARAQQLRPALHFVQCDLENLDLGEKFDYILFEHIFDTVDVLAALERVRRHCTGETRLIIINYSQLWQPLLEWASAAGLRSRFVEPNWVTENDLRNFLKLSGFRPVRTHRAVLMPKWIPLLSGLLNDFVARLPVLRRLCLMQVMVARCLPEPRRERDVTASIIIPCRNERGNIQPAVERIPSVGKWTEILFCDDKSTDGTADEVRRMQNLHPEKNIQLISGPGICKASNVWAGFRAARGDVLMILDADLSVMPEELPVFFRTLVSGRGEFVNGSRLVYPMQRYAMKFANMIGNKFFGRLFSFLLDQRIKDTLCGTKVLWRKDWSRMENNVGIWGIRDLWGDYELLFGASKLHLEIVEVPVHYQERIYGVTKMTTVFVNGARMLGICWHAWLRLGA